MSSRLYVSFTCVVPKVWMESEEFLHKHLCVASLAKPYDGYTDDHWFEFRLGSPLSWKQSEESYSRQVVSRRCLVALPLAVNVMPKWLTVPLPITAQNHYGGDSVVYGTLRWETERERKSSKKTDTNRCMTEWYIQNLHRDGNSFTWHQQCNSQRALSVYHFRGYKNTRYKGIHSPVPNKPCGLCRRLLTY